MGRVRVISNRVPQVIERLPREVDRAVDDTADGIAEQVRAGAWVDTGVLVSTVKPETDGPPMRSTVGIGEHEGRGFYAGFNEFGTSRQTARPVVVPAAHAHEPVLAVEVADAVQRAAT